MTDSLETFLARSFTHSEARVEVEKECLSFAHFIRDVGSKPQYTGVELMDWIVEVY